MTELALEETRCPMCGARRWSPVLEAPETGDPGGPRYAVVSCEACGLWFTNPRPAESAMGRFYRDDYPPHQARHARPDKVRVPGWWARTSARLRRRCPDRRWLAPHGRMRLLDVGCGSGVFLERMHQQGWDVTGLDVSEKMVRRIREELGLRALAGTLPHAELAPEGYDVVTLWQTLEHVHRPLETLGQVRGLLVPGGRLIVSVPNAASAPAAWFGPAWNGLELPRHLVHFSPATLREMLGRAGFEPGPVRMVRHASWLRISARIAREQGLARPWHRLLAFRPVGQALEWCSLLRARSACITVTATTPSTGSPP